MNFIDLFFYLDVLKKLSNHKFDEVSKLFEKEPNMTNSMRDEEERTFLMWAVITKEKDCVEFLLNHPHDLSVDLVGYNILHLIVLWNDDDVAIEMLKCLETFSLNNDIINKQSNYEETPLHRAAEKNKYKSICWLIEHGADCSLQDTDGLRPGQHRDCNKETKEIIYRKSGKKYE